MKNFLLIFILLFLASTGSMAQTTVYMPPLSVPQGINYQAIVRDNSGNALSGAAVSFRVSILQGKTDGPSKYTETHKVTTDANGLVNFIVLQGTPVSGNATLITWYQEGPYFLQIELDRSGGSSYQLIGTSQLLSVPYALNAGSAITAGPYYYVGQKAEGGIVIATWDGGRHGWVAALEDISKSTTWNNAEMLVQADTTGGYRDWKLPSVAQLKLMYEQRPIIGGFSSSGYWSSNTKFAWESVYINTPIQTLYTADEAYFLIFSGGNSGRENSIYKTYSDSNDPIGVRAVRVF